MARYRNRLPQLSENIFLTDGGMETDLIFHEGFQLPYFAAVVLLENERGAEVLRRYYRRHASIARVSGVGFILEAVTWRASPDWGARLGYTEKALDEANRKAIELLVALRAEFDGAIPLVISAAIGPRGDAYRPSDLMTAVDAERYHSTQLRVVRDTEADLVTAMTLTHVGEAVGIARGARAEGLPVVISFTVETDGVLPGGTSLRDAIAAVDDQTDGAPAHYAPTICMAMGMPSRARAMGTTTDGQPARFHGGQNHIQRATLRVAISRARRPVRSVAGAVAVAMASALRQPVRPPESPPLRSGRASASCPACPLMSWAARRRTPSARAATTWRRLRRGAHAARQGSRTRRA